MVFLLGVSLISPERHNLHNFGWRLIMLETSSKICVAFCRDVEALTETLVGCVGNNSSLAMRIEHNKVFPFFFPMVNKVRLNFGEVSLFRQPSNDLSQLVCQSNSLN